MEGGERQRRVVIHPIGQVGEEDIDGIVHVLRKERFAHEQSEADRAMCRAGEEDNVPDSRVAGATGAT